MASKVQICNLALIRVGASRITSLSDNTETAKLCNTLYDDTAEEVMSRGEWTSVITRATLNQTTNTPAYGFAFEFQLPTNPRQLKILDINEITTGDVAFRIEGDKLLSDESTMKIRYMGFLDDTGSYDTYLKRSITLKLSSLLALPLTGSVQLANNLNIEYERSITSGLAMNGQQGSNEMTTSPDLHQVR